MPTQRALSLRDDKCARNLGALQQDQGAKGWPKCSLSFANCWKPLLWSRDAAEGRKRREHVVDRNDPEMRSTNSRKSQLP